MVDLSFVIIGKNAAWSIDRLLASITTLRPSQLLTDLVYVDSASTDNTIDIVERYDATILRLEAGQPLCASAGRWVGCRHSTGKYVLFVDSDMELQLGFIDKALIALENDATIAAVTGSLIDINVNAKPHEVPPTTDYPAADGSRLTDVKYAGNAAIFRRSVLEQVGSWNPYIISDEEPELCLRIRHAGYRVVRLNTCACRHYTIPKGTMTWLVRRRRVRLFVGYGQTLRYCVKNKLLLPYLRERGYCLAGLMAILLAAASGISSCMLKSVTPLAGYCGLMSIAFVLDAIRVGSVSGAIFHAVHRSFILEGTIRGVFMRAPDPDEYVPTITVWSSAPSVTYGTLPLRKKAL